MTPHAQLPAVARAKLTAIEQSAADATALAASTTAAIGAKQQLQEGLLNRRDSASDPKVSAEAQAALDQLDAEIEALRETQARRLARRNSDTQTALQLRRWLDTLPPGTALAPVAVDPGSGAALQSLHSVRAALAAHQSELRSIRRAPLPPADLKAAARRTVELLAQQARPTIRSSGVIEFAHGVLPAALLAWAHPAAMVAALERDIDALPLDPRAVGAADRPTRAAELVTAILEAERVEEALVSAALAIGQDAERRVRADPRAILGVEIVVAAGAERRAA